MRVCSKSHTLPLSALGFVGAFILSFLLATEANAGEVKVSGKIRTANLRPLANVKILFAEIALQHDGKLLEIRTDVNGRYDAILPRGAYEVELDEWAGDIDSIETPFPCLKQCEGFFNLVKRSSVDLSQYSAFTLDMFVPIEGFSDTKRSRHEASYDELLDGAGKKLIIRYLRRDELNPDVVEYS